MKLTFGWGSLELFGSTPYSICDASSASVLGLAFERQRGVHAIGGERRVDFDAWPGELAYTSPDVHIFSESAHGGEYLALHVADQAPALAAPRRVCHGDRAAVRLGHGLRSLMLAAQPDRERIEQQAAWFLMRGAALLATPSTASSRYAPDRRSHQRVLDYIDSAIDSPLGLDHLAQLAQMPLLRFLRSFASAVGMTPHAYITERRLQRARALMRSTDTALAAIAADCGFAHQSHLGAAFKARVGMSPFQYRKLTRQRD